MCAVRIQVVNFIHTFLTTNYLMYIVQLISRGWLVVVKMKHERSPEVIKSLSM